MKPDTKSDAKPAAAERRMVGPSLRMDRICAADGGYLFQRWQMELSADNAYEDLFEPAFWGNIAGRFQRGATIAVYAEDGSWYGELIVWTCGSNFAHVGELRERLTRPEAAIGTESLSDFTIEHRGAVKKWRIVRNADKQELKSGLPSEEAARGWLRDYRQITTKVA